MGIRNLVTLVVLYAPLPDSGSRRQTAQPTLPPVRIRMDAVVANLAVEHHCRNYQVTAALFTNVDADGNRFSVDVGRRAVAVYSEA